MKVYTYTNPRRRECPLNADGSGSRSTYEVVAASSKFEARDAFIGIGRRVALGDITKATNKRGIEVATAEPGVVFWRPVDARGADRGRWVRHGEQWSEEAP